MHELKIIGGEIELLLTSADYLIMTPWGGAGSGDRLYRANVLWCNFAMLDDTAHELAFYARTNMQLKLHLVGYE